MMQQIAVAAWGLGVGSLMVLLGIDLLVEFRDERRRRRARKKLLGV